MNLDQKALILGIGNSFQGDDGIGPKIVCDLEKLIHDPRLHFKTLITSNLDLIDLIKGYDSLIIIDGIKTADQKPGNISQYSVENYIPTVHLENYHDSSFKHIIQLGRELEIPLPQEIKVIAVEIFERMVFSNLLSLQLQKKYSLILKKIAAIVKNYFQKQFSYETI